MLRCLSVALLQIFADGRQTPSMGKPENLAAIS